MGVRFSANHNVTCVGIVLPVNETELQLFDEREKGYVRCELNLTNVDPVDFLDDDHE